MAHWATMVRLGRMWAGAQSCSWWCCSLCCAMIAVRVLVSHSLNHHPLISTTDLRSFLSKMLHRNCSWYVGQQPSWTGRLRSSWPQTNHSCWWIHCAVQYRGHWRHSNRQKRLFPGQQDPLPTASITGVLSFCRWEFKKYSSAYKHSILPHFKEDLHQQFFKKKSTF